MSDVVRTVFAFHCEGLGYAVVLAALCVTATLIGVVNRTNRLLRAYFIDGDWSELVHHPGPGARCDACGHHLGVHDRSTGRCCYGTAQEHLAVLIALPLPPLVRDMLQQAGCSCRRAPDRT